MSENNDPNPPQLLNFLKNVLILLRAPLSQPYLILKTVLTNLTLGECRLSHGWV